MQLMFSCMYTTLNVMIIIAVCDAHVLNEFSDWYPVYFQ